MANGKQVTTNYQPTLGFAWPKSLDSDMFFVSKICLYTLFVVHVLTRESS